MSNGFLAIGSHPDSRVPSYLICQIQLSFKFLIIVSLTLHDHFGGGHAYLSRNNDFHSIGNGKGVAPVGRLDVVR